MPVRCIVKHASGDSGMITRASLDHAEPGMIRFGRHPGSEMFASAVIIDYEAATKARTRRSTKSRNEV